MGRWAGQRTGPLATGGVVRPGHVHDALRAGAVGLTLVAGYWLLESAVHAFVLHRGTFVQGLVPRSPNELWMRTLIAALLLAISGLVMLRPPGGAAGELGVLGRAVETASEAVLVTDPKGHIRYVNPAFTRITGYAPAEVLGRTPAVLGSGTRDAAFYRGLWETIGAGRVWVGTLTDRRRDGTFYPARLTIAPVLDAHGRVTHYVGVQVDESERAALAARAEESAKLAQVGRLVGGVAHDFNNALTTLGALSDLAARKARGDAELEELLSGIDVALEGAAALVRQLLDYLREGSPDAPVGVLDLPAFARRVRPALEALVPEAVAFEVTPPPPGTSVRADAHALQHVLANLVLNAVDAVADRPAPRIALGFDAGDGDGRGPVVIEVADNGTGIARDRREAIFEPFYTTKGEGRGTGLGLASARETVRRFGGEIVLADTSAAGSTFAVRLSRA